MCRGSKERRCQGLQMRHKVRVKVGVMVYTEGHNRKSGEKGRRKEEGAGGEMGRGRAGEEREQE